MQHGWTAGGWLKAAAHTAAEQWQDWLLEACFPPAHTGGIQESLHKCTTSAEHHSPQAQLQLLTEELVRSHGCIDFACVTLLGSEEYDTFGVAALHGRGAEHFPAVLNASRNNTAKAWLHEAATTTEDSSRTSSSNRSSSGYCSNEQQEGPHCLSHSLKRGAVWELPDVTPLSTEEQQQQHSSTGHQAQPVAPPQRFTLSPKQVFVTTGNDWAVEDVRDSGLPCFYDGLGKERGLPCEASLLASAGMKSMLSIPCSHEGTLWGVLTVASSHRRLNHRFLPSLQHLTHQITPLVVKARHDLNVVLSDGQASKHLSTNDLASCMLDEMVQLDKKMFKRLTANDKPDAAKGDTSPASSVNKDHFYPTENCQSIFQPPSSPIPIPHSSSTTQHRSRADRQRHSIDVVRVQQHDRSQHRSSQRPNSVDAVKVQQPHVQQQHSTTCNSSTQETSYYKTEQQYSSTQSTSYYKTESRKEDRRGGRTGRREENSIDRTPLVRSPGRASYNGAGMVHSDISTLLGQAMDCDPYAFSTSTTRTSAAMSIAPPRTPSRNSCDVPRTFTRASCDGPRTFTNNSGASPSTCNYGLPSLTGCSQRLPPQHASCPSSNRNSLQGPGRLSVCVGKDDDVCHNEGNNSCDFHSQSPGQYMVSDLIHNSRAEQRDQQSQSTRHSHSQQQQHSQQQHTQHQQHAQQHPLSTRQQQQQHRQRVWDQQEQVQSPSHRQQQSPSHTQQQQHSHSQQQQSQQQCARPFSPVRMEDGRYSSSSCCTPPSHCRGSATGVPLVHCLSDLAGRGERGSVQQPATAKHTKMATRLSTGAAPVPYQSAMGYESERGAHECEGFGQGSLSLEPQGVFGSQFRSQAVWEGAERERERNDDEWDSGKEHSQNSQNGSWPRGYLLSRSSSCASENNNGEDPKMWGLDVFENDNSVLDDFSRRLQGSVAYKAAVAQAQDDHEESMVLAASAAPSRNRSMSGLGSSYSNSGQHSSLAGLGSPNEMCVNAEEHEQHMVSDLVHSRRGSLTGAQAAGVRAKGVSKSVHQQNQQRGVELEQWKLKLLQKRQRKHQSQQQEAAEKAQAEQVQALLLAAERERQQAAQHEQLLLQQQREKKRVSEQVEKQRVAEQQQQERDAEREVPSDPDLPLSNDTLFIPISSFEPHSHPLPLLTTHNVDADEEPPQRAHFSGSHLLYSLTEGEEEP